MQKSSSTLQFARRRLSGISLRETDAHWVPNTDVYVTESGVVIKVELAGMQRENLQLNIRGNRPDGCRTSSKCKFLVMEINYGTFESVIELPAGYDLCQAKATYQNGF